MLNQILHGIILAMVTVVCIWVAHFGKKFIDVALNRLRMLNEKYQFDIDERKFMTMIDIFTDTVKDAIIATNQTYVNDLKKNGSLSEDQAEIAMETTIQYCKDMLSQNVMKYFEDRCDNIDDFIVAMAESMIGASKKH